MLALRSIQPEVHYSNRKVESQEKRGRKIIQIPHLITERIDLERLTEYTRIATSNDEDTAVSGNIVAKQWS